MLILILSLKYLIGINYVNKSESLMSFQEMLVSKKQKKQKNTQNAQKPKLAKKTKIATFRIFNSYHNNKTKLKFITRIF